jgi:hypothetical protein
VSLSELYKQDDGPGLLIRQQPITPAAIQSTKLKVAALAGKLSFTFHSRFSTDKDNDLDPLGRCYVCIHDVLTQFARTTKTRIDLRKSDPVLRKFRPFICLNIKFIHIALRHRFNPTRHSAPSNLSLGAYTHIPSVLSFVYV